MIAVSLYILFVGIILATWFIRGRNPSNLPPGPPADPIIGHVRIMPTANQGDVFHEWAKIYGDVMYLNCLGRSMVVLDSVQAATDLLDKRSQNYSNRPRFVIFELMNADKFLGLLPYGKHFQKNRKLFQQYFNPKACLAFRSMQTEEARTLVTNLIKNAGDPNRFLVRFSAAIIMRVAYGHRVVSDDDEFVQLADECGYVFSNSGPPGSTLVDFFPFLKHMPSWFPGTFYASFARDSRPLMEKSRDIPFDIVQKQMAAGTAEASFLEFHLDRVSREENTTPDDLDDLKVAAATIYGAGAETTWTTLSVFLLAMLLYPDCQARAREEIDAVIGLDRLPELSDRESLPYVESIVQEAFRWHPAAPLGIPHRTSEDDTYKGMFIPAGSLVITNIQGMAHDENVYANPGNFDPTRFLPKPSGNGEPHFNAVFGFGRRICPGMHLADNSVWIAIASILATLQISKKVGDDGNEVVPEVVFTDGISSQPKPYQCIIRPRSEWVRSLLS